MRTTLMLAEDVYQSALTLAQSSGKSLGEIISTLARRGLQATAPRSSQAGIPVFSIPSGAEIIPGNRVSELLDDDGT